MDEQEFTIKDATAENVVGRQVWARYPRSWSAIIERVISFSKYDDGETVYMEFESTMGNYYYFKSDIDNGGIR